MNIYDLVRRDLIDCEKQDMLQIGAPREPYSGQGGEALLDAYQAAIDQVLALRGVIEMMTIGDGSFDPKPPKLTASMARTVDPITDWPA